ncbi:MAG: DUF1501 domain-containing protein [Bryobacterales bacterium]
MTCLNKARSIDRPMTALIQDLKQRGLLDDTIIVWGGEFGRTPMRENRGGKYTEYVGRDHHPHGFTMWMAGGGIKRTTTARPMRSATTWKKQAHPA